MKMKKNILALAVAASLAGFAGQAAAGTASATYNTYAAEALSSLTAIASPSMAYQTNVVLAAGTDFTMYLRMNDGGAFVSPTTFAVTDFELGAAAVNPDSVTLSADKTTLKATWSNLAASHATGTLISVASAAASMNLSGAATSLATGGNVSATFALANGIPASATIVAADVIDSADGTVAKAEQAITGVIVASDAFTSAFAGAVTETQQIDVAQQALQMTSGANTADVDIVNLGGFVFSNASGTQLAADGADFVLGTGNEVDEVQFTISGTFIDDDNNTVTTPAAMFVATNPACTAGAMALTYNSTTGNYAAAAGDVTGLADATPLYVCYQPNKTAATNATVAETTPVLSGITLVDSTAPTVAIKTFANATMYALTLNGTRANLINYVPAAAAPYTSWIRLANNGAVDANVITATFIAADGTTLGSGDLPVLAQGASYTLDAAAVEAATGVTLAAGDRPQVQIYATTDQLDVQTYLSDPNGGFTNMTFDTSK